MEAWRNKGKRRKEIFQRVTPNCILVVLDTETTGLADDAEIIQFAAMKYRVESNLTLSPLDEIDVYIRPKTPLVKKITDITGISNEMLKHEPSEEQITPKIVSFLSDCDVIAGYNVEFDMKKIRFLSYRTGYFFRECPTLDVLEMTRDMIAQSEIDSYALQSVISYLYPDNTFQFHSAIEDVRATAQILQQMLFQYWKFQDKQVYEPIHLEKGYLFINPKQKSMQRIYVKINKGDVDDIFYDLLRKCWSCNATSRAIALFQSIDKESLEDQFLDKYGYRFGHRTMDEIGRSWLKYYRQKHKKH